MEQGQNQVSQEVKETDTIFVRATIGGVSYDIGLAPTIAQLRDNPQVLSLIGPAFVKLVEHLTGISVPKARSNFQDVGDFHEKFGLDFVGDNPLLGSLPSGSEMNAELMQFRMKFMAEELQEFMEGYEQLDIAQMADALVDLAYVVFGTAHLLTLPWQELWDDVQAANMRKVRALTDGSDSKRGSSYDVVKPEGWVGPNTHEILRKHGFNV